MSSQFVPFRMPAAAGARQGEGPHGGEAGGALQERIIEALRTVYDPEIPVNIYDLGLIYTLDVDQQGRVRVEMTLTAPACPVAETMPCQVEEALRSVAGIEDACVELVWDPPWTKERMSEEARLMLDML